MSNEIERFKQWLHVIRDELDANDLDQLRNMRRGDLYAFYLADVDPSDMADPILFNHISYDGPYISALMLERNYNTRNIDFSRLKDLGVLFFMDSNAPTEQELQRLNELPSITGVYILSEDKSNSIDNINDLFPIDWNYATDLDPDRRYNFAYYMLDTSEFFEEED